MTNTDEELQAILERFACSFAQKNDDEDGIYWWGHDTNLGTQSTAFSVAKRSIRAFKARHLKSTKPIERYKDLGYINRKALANAVWGNKVPGWWHGSQGEFELLTAVARAKS